MKYTYNDLERMTVADLKVIMRENNIKPMTGRKSDLIDRVAAHFMTRNTRTRDSKNRKYEAPESEHLKNPVKAKKIEGDKTMYFQRKEIRVILEKVVNVEDDVKREMYDEAASKLKYYVGKDRSEYIVKLLVSFYTNLRTNLTELVVLLDSIIGIFSNEMTYAELERYLVPALTEITTSIQYSKKYKRQAKRFAKTINAFVKKGFDGNTMLVVLARAESEKPWQRILTEYMEVAKINVVDVKLVLIEEKDYLQERTTGKIRMPKKSEVDDDPDDLYLLLTQIDYLMSKVDKDRIV